MMRMLVISAVACGFAHAAVAQSLEERLDEDRFLRGLSELNLPEVLDHYMRTHPPDDPARAADYAIALERMNLRQPGLSAKQREAIVQRILDRRAKLLANHGDDSRRAMWLADQATDLYFELLPIDGSGITTLLGMPNAEQRTRAETVARQMYELAAEAELAIEQAILELETTPGFSQDITLQLQRRRLADEHRDRRIPFLHGVGAYLHAKLNVTDERDRRRHFGMAATLLAPLGNHLHPPLSHQARLYAAFALNELGRRDEATAAFEEVLQHADDDPVLAVSAGIGLARTHAATNRAAALQYLDRLAGQYRSADDLFYRLLVADARFRLLREHDADQAFAAYIELIDADIDVPPDRMRDVVFARMVRTVDPSMDAADLPPIAAVAQASRLAQSPQTRGKGISALEELLAGSSLHERERALALFTLGRAKQADNKLLDAAGHYLKIATKHPMAPEAERSAELACTIAAVVHREDPDAAVPVLRQAIDVLLEQYPYLASADRWRYTAGRLALSEDRFDEAQGYFQNITPDSHHWHDALYMQVDVLRRAADAAHDESRRSELHAQLRDTITDVRPILQRGVRAADDAEHAQRLRNRLASLQVMEAEALLASDQNQAALDAVRGVDRDGEIDGSIIAEALKVRIEAFRALGRAADAQAELERFMRAAPQRVVDVIEPWLAGIERTVQSLLDRHQDELAVQLARREMVPVAQRLEPWLKSEGSAYADALLPRVAEAYRLSAMHEQALAVYDRLLADQPNAAQYLFGRAECLYHLSRQDDESERLGEAMTIYRRLVVAGPSVGEFRYWQSHLRTLEILDRTGRNTHQIAPQIQRLRERDPALGGERFRRRFEQLQNQYAGR